MLGGGELDGARVLPAAYVALMTREQTVGSLWAADDRCAPHHALPGQAGSTDRSCLAGVVRSQRSDGDRLWIDPLHDLVVVYLTGPRLPARLIDATVAAVYAALR